MLGYKGDLIGEAALLAFTHHETRNIGVGMIATMAWFTRGARFSTVAGAQGEQLGSSGNRGTSGSLVRWQRFDASSASTAWSNINPCAQTKST